MSQNIIRLSQLTLPHAILMRTLHIPPWTIQWWTGTGGVIEFKLNASCAYHENSITIDSNESWKRSRRISLVCIIRILGIVWVPFDTLNIDGPGHTLAHDISWQSSVWNTAKGIHGMVIYAHISTLGCRLSMCAIYMSADIHAAATFILKESMCTIYI